MLTRFRHSIDNVFAGRKSVKLFTGGKTREVCESRLPPAEKRLLPDFLNIPQFRQFWEHLGTSDSDGNVLGLQIDVVAGKVEEHEMLTTSNGAWHVDGAAEAVFIYQVSEPDGTAPTQFLLPFDGEIDASMVTSGSLDNLLAPMKLNLYEARSGDVILITKSTIHRSTAAREKGRRYFLRWSFFRQKPFYYLLYDYHSITFEEPDR